MENIERVTGLGLDLDFNINKYFVVNESDKVVQELTPPTTPHNQILN